MTTPLQQRLRHAALTVSALCLVMVAAVGWEHIATRQGNVLPASSVPTDTSPVRLVIDPGHGGEDGGTSSADGVLVEKDLNLAVSRRMGDIADLLGIPTVLTRREDTLLYDRFQDLPDYTGKKKTYDLRNRLRLAEEHPSALFCSIHMNRFPSPDCQGLQVYFSPNHEKSHPAATLVQTYGKTYLDEGNHRQIKKATSAIYLLHRIKTPAILVECGFLSSPVDSGNLREDGYRLKLAMVVTAALVEGIVG